MYDDPGHCDPGYALTQMTEPLACGGRQAKRRSSPVEVNGMQVDADVLKRRLREALSDRANYPITARTLDGVIHNAVAVASSVVDELCGGHVARQGKAQRKRTGPSREELAHDKRRRLKEALADGPLHYGELGRRARLTTGELSWLLKSTPGVLRVGPGRYSLGR
jgi:hypothetical protein